MTVKVWRVPAGAGAGSPLQLTAAQKLRARSASVRQSACSLIYLAAYLTW